MNSWSLAFQAIAVVVILFTAFLVDRWKGAVAALLLAGLLVVVGTSVLAGQPKPVSWELLNYGVSEAQVLWGTSKPGEGIFLVLTWKGQPEPRLFVLPWDPRLAEDLDQARAQNRRTGMGVTMRHPFKGAKSAGKSGQPGQPGQGDRPGEGQGSGTRSGGGQRDGAGADQPRFWSPPPPSVPPKDLLQ